MKRATVHDYARMCKKIGDCMNCLLGVANNGADMVCRDFVATCPNKANEIILDWCKGHPVETRQSKFLKMFPNAVTNENGRISVCPKNLDRNYTCKLKPNECGKCLDNYWLAEVDENE